MLVHQRNAPMAMSQLGTRRLALAFCTMRGKADPALRWPSCRFSKLIWETDSAIKGVEGKRAYQGLELKSLVVMQALPSIKDLEPSSILGVVIGAWWSVVW